VVVVEVERAIQWSVPGISYDFSVLDNLLEEEVLMEEQQDREDDEQEIGDQVVIW